MKKLILSLVFVLASGTSLISAENSLNEYLNNKEEIFDCFSVADEMANVLGVLLNLTDEQEYDNFAYYYDLCMDGAPYQMTFPQE